MAAGTLLVEIGMSIARLQSDMGRATSVFKKGMAQMSSDVAMVKNALTGLVSIGALTAIGKSAIDLGSQLTDMSARVGVAASDLSALSYPAKMVGVQIEDLGNAFKFMMKNIAEAENAESDQALALDILGVKLDELKGKTPLEQFLRLAEAFNRLEKDENRMAVGLTMFGKGFASVAPLVDKGSAAIVRFMEYAKANGIALSETEIKKLDDYGDAYDRLGMKIKSFAGRAIIELGEFFDWLTLQGPIQQNAVKKLNEALDAFLEKRGLLDRGVKTGKIADILVENPDKVAARNIEAEKARRKKEKEDKEKAAKETDRLDKEYLKIHASNIAEEGKMVHDALAAEMGMDQEYFDTRAKMRMDDFKDWQKTEEENAKLEEKYYTDKIDQLQSLQDAQREEFEITEQIADYRAEDAFNAAMQWGNAEQALRLLNDGLYEHFRVLGEGMEKVSALTNLYNTVFRGKDGVIADFANVAVRAFHGMTEALVDFVMTGKNNFRDFANSVISDIMRIAVRQAIVQPIAQGLMGAFGMATVPARASGGPVFPGSTYLVGERGPELFSPSSAGNIVPNGGSGNVTVNVQNNSGSPVAVKKSVSFDTQGMVIDMVIDGINRDVHGIRTILGGA